MFDFENYQRTTEKIKDDILEQNRILSRKLAEKEQSLELLKFVHFDKSIDLDTLNDIIIGCTGCLHSMMFYKHQVITDLDPESATYKTILKNLDTITKGDSLYMSDDVLEGYTTVRYPISSSQMLSDSKAFVKNIILLYPSKFVNHEVMDFIKWFMIVNEVLINIVLTRDRMVELIETDPLTKTLNRSSWNASIEQLAAERSTFFVIFIDIDKFKIINDTLGHQRGDDVLRFTGAWLRNSFRSEDRVFRMGGDEFAVSGKVNPENRAGLVEKLKTLNVNYINMIWQFLGVEATISIGALISAGNLTEKEIYARVDNLLYQSKSNGRDTIHIISEFDSDQEVSTIP